MRMTNPQQNNIDINALLTGVNEQSSLTALEVATLIRTLNDRLQHQGQQLTAQFETQLQAQRDTMQTLINSNSHGMKPEKITVQAFDGVHVLYPQFETGLKAKFRKEASRFPDEESKLLFAIGLLQKDAATRMTPWVQSAQGTPGAFTLEKFFAQMRLQFNDEDRQRKSSNELNELKQGQSSFDEYHAKFQRLLYESGNGLSWDDSNKISRFQFGMNVKLQKATIAVIGCNFEQYVRDVKIIAERLESIERRSNNWRGGNNNARNAPPVSRDAMDWEPTVNALSNRRAKWVDERELQRRKDNHLCYRCGSSEHIVNRCPYQPASRPGGRHPHAPRVSRVKESPQLEENDEENNEKVKDQGKE